MCIRWIRIRIQIWNTGTNQICFTTDPKSAIGSMPRKSHDTVSFKLLFVVQVHRLVHQLPAMNQKMLGILLTHLNRVANKCDKVPYFPVLRIRMFIYDPDIFPSRIPDPKTVKKRGVKNLLSYLFVATNITKLKIILSLNW